MTLSSGDSGRARNSCATRQKKRPPTGSTHERETDADEATVAAHRVEHPPAERQGLLPARDRDRDG